MSFHPDGGEFHDWLFLALAEHRLGHANPAKEAIVKLGWTQPSERKELETWKEAGPPSKK